MKKRNKKHENRVKRLVILCAIWAVVISVATYAWFIGMRTVNVSTFDVSIASVDSLSLSLDGKTWSDNVTINKDTVLSDYTSNTNSWTNLIPISSVGKINPESSTLVMYEKGSLTATPGGYRLMASQVQNTTLKDGKYPEAKGYVAFDLFIKNLSGTAYYDLDNVLNEEAIYLTPESAVTVAQDGGVKGTGIENSVRVAFAPIGRVVATTNDVSTIQGITCVPGENSTVTGTCNRTARIWEPNDTKHVQNAIEWYKESCKARSGEDITTAAAYGSGTCGTVADGTARKTYAVSGVIDYTDKVDVYDGEQYNGYTNTISATAANGKLLDFPYFTDTMKNLQGTARPEFMTLAPNSITKVRVYIWIEGQDIDNYDFASLGRKISVNFGFTKERFYGSDINYDNTNIYELTKDTKFVEGKTYYTKDSEGYSTATVTAGDTVEANTYYEKQNLSDANSDKPANNDYYNTNPNYEAPTTNPTTGG